LPNIRCFSLTSIIETPFYNDLIVPFLQQMSNLEKLDLYIAFEQETFVDGNNLKNDIINHLGRLSKFTFNIRSFINHHNQTHSLSNEEIQHSLAGLGDNQVITYVDYFLKKGSAQCHFYSYPYTWMYYNNITNSFSCGLFKCVREVSLFDNRPFEHEFFVRIAQSFPMMQKLSMINRTAQNQKANNSNEHISIIEYLHLLELDFAHTHDDYIEQLLLDTNTCLPKNICLWVPYDSLKRVTSNFTRVATRVNCTKISSLRTYDRIHLSESITEYFPHAKILYF
jgi:hypothetical protein